jgi:hypothetical protein
MFVRCHPPTRPTISASAGRDAELPLIIGDPATTWRERTAVSSSVYPERVWR